MTCQIQRHDLILGREGVELLPPERPVASPAVNEDERDVPVATHVVHDGDPVGRGERVHGDRGSGAFRGSLTGDEAEARGKGDGR